MHQSVDRRFSTRLHDSMFGNDGGDESSGGDVEGGVESLSTGRCDLDTPDGRDFRSITKFDFDLVTGSS